MSTSDTSYDQKCPACECFPDSETKQGHARLAENGRSQNSPLDDLASLAGEPLLSQLHSKLLDLNRRRIDLDLEWQHTLESARQCRSSGVSKILQLLLLSTSRN